MRDSSAYGLRMTGQQNQGGELLVARWFAEHWPSYRVAAQPALCCSLCFLSSNLRSLYPAGAKAQTEKSLDTSAS